MTDILGMLRSSPLAFLIQLCFFAALASSCGRGPAAAEVPVTAGSGTNAIAITTAVATAREVPLVVDVPGNFLPDESSDVAAEGSGRVAATPVDIGDRVARGAVLAQLDNRDAQLRLDQSSAAHQQALAALNQARERHRLAQTTAARYDSLVKSGDVSRAVYDQLVSERDTSAQAVMTAEAGVLEAKSRIALAEKALADTTIRAPFDGHVTDRAVTVGEFVGPGTRIATVMRLDPIKLRMQVPEVAAAKIRRGQTVVANVEALGNASVTATVTAVSAALDPTTRAFIVEATAPNRDGRLRAQMFATARIEIGASETGVFIPRAAVLTDPNTNSFQAFVVEQGVVRLRVLQVAGEDQQQVRVRSGLDAGAVVATSALDQLFDGAVVNVTAAGRADTPGASR
ncbi:MAG TPA: efflux RND transporter periplasmic adaptor subunit [Vicinamibacterales bacterium]|nr:efflux RND transporter periplasmic adaptor subunit [Vicinamibacterales bacterium]